MTVHLAPDMRAEMAKVVVGLPTKSAKIRALGDAGYARGDIARFLDIRYQHVRNVLVQAQEKEERAVQNETAASPPAQIWTQVGPDGRVVIPAAYRGLLGIEGGGHLFMVLEGDEVRLMGRDGALRRAQELVAPYLEDESMSTDAFLADRRREAQREEEKDRQGG